MRESKDIDLLLATWKKQKNHSELFVDLQDFVACYPRYNITTLIDAFSFGKFVFEDDELRIKKKTIITSPKPDFPPMFFWEFRYDQIDWQASCNTVIQRILERGFKKEWEELVRYYGRPQIAQALKEKIGFLPDEIIDEVSLVFNLPKENMLCYKRKQLLPNHWL